MLRENEMENWAAFRRSRSSRHLPLKIGNFDTNQISFFGLQFYTMCTNLYYPGDQLTSFQEFFEIIVDNLA